MTIIRVQAGVALALFLSCFQVASAMEIRQYTATSEQQGQVVVEMGRHDFCALTSVASGGFNSSCSVKKQGHGWVLIAQDPPAPDAYQGETQHCQASCFSIVGGSTAEKDPSPVTSPSQPTSAQYLGCYKDNAARDLTGFKLESASMTTQTCLDLCQQKGFTYAGTQFRTHCFCGDSYGKYGKTSNCNMRCSGKSSETCGGSWANSVYRVK